MTKVLFVCLGNICRSPTAQGIFEKKVKEAGLDHEFIIDSCGTIAYHQGEPADPRMRKHAEKRGYVLRSLARGLETDDLNDFDWILTMDDNNYKHIMAQATESQKTKIKKITDFCTKHNFTQIPDPYRGGDKGFELVIDLLEDACDELLIHISHELSHVKRKGHR